MENKIKAIIEAADKRGYEVTIRDVSYALMRVRFDDKLIAYTVIKGTGPDNEADVDSYDSMDKIQYLIRYFLEEMKPKEVPVQTNEQIIEALTKKSETSAEGSLSFEDNRAGIEKQIDEILELKNQLIDENGICTDVKTMATLQKTEMDARSRLNDKFGAADKSKQQYVIVQPKMNHICEITRKECWLQTRDFAMQHWHLIEDPNYKE